jgi:hypothetical protein
MKKIFLLLLTLVFLVVVARKIELLPLQDSSDPVESLVTTEPGEEGSDVKHYSDDLLSFDYPADLDIFKSTQGEGAWSETLNFIQMSKEEEVYNYAGPVIFISSWGANKPAEEQYAADRAELGDLAEELAFPGVQAFAWTVPDEFGGQPYPGLEFLITKPSPDAPEGISKLYFLGTISRPTNAPYDEALYLEILQLFKDTVQFR